MLRSLLLALVAGLVAAPALSQTVIYVDADASGADDGSSWANAFEELDDALDAATNSTEIWVAEGVYLPTDDGERTVSFVLKSGVAVLGGFAGTETSADQRTPDPDEGGTVLSGDIGTADDASDNSYHVVRASGVDETAVLDGFLVTGGNANGTFPDERGGGLTNSGPGDNGAPTLRNVAFIGNRAIFGGGAYLGGTSSEIVLEDVEFKENQASRLGGGLFSDALVNGEGVEFEENVAVERGGGAFFGQQGVTVLRDVEFDSNVVGLSSSSTAPHRGGGVHIERTASLTLVDAEFELNRALGVFGDGGGLNVQDSPTVEIVNTVFNGNVADRGGAGLLTRNGVQAGAATVRITNAVFAGNAAEESASGTLDFRDGSTVELTNVTMSGNEGFAALVADATSSVEDSIVDGGFPTGEAISTADPLFVRAPDDGDDDDWGTDDDDYGDLRLRAGSPAINTGDGGDLPLDTFDLDDDGDEAEALSLDLDGEVRVQDGRVDLGPYECATAVVSSESESGAVTLSLSAPAPNPTRGQAVLSLTVATAGEVEVSVVDALGRRVARLHAGPLSSGTHPVRFDGSALPAGVYVVRAVTLAGATTRTLTIVR